MGGSMSSAMRSAILSYLTGSRQARRISSMVLRRLRPQQSNRIRAVVHLIVTSPEFTIQQ